MHVINLAYPSNGAANPAFNSNTLDVQVVGAPNAVSIDATAATSQIPTAGPGEIVTLVATVTGLDRDSDGSPDPAADGTVVTWVATAGTVLTTDLDDGANGVQTVTFGGMTTLQVLSTGANQTAIITAAAAGVAGVANQTVTYSVGVQTVIPASVAVTADDAELEVGESTTVPATVTNSDDSAGTGVLGQFAESFSVVALSSNNV